MSHVITLRVPDSLYARVKKPAKGDGISLIVPLALALLFALAPVLAALVDDSPPVPRAGQTHGTYLPLITAPDPSRQASCAVAIMPLGDSITHGYGDPQMLGYRRELFDALAGAGYLVNFVGSRKAGFVLDIDRDNEAHPGQEAFYIRDRMAAFLDMNHPDIILLHIGTNGLRNKSADVVAQEVDGILTEIYAFDNGITVFLARIINRVEAPELVQKTSRFNELLQVMADRRAAAGDPLVVVDMEHALTYTAPDDNGQVVLVDMYDPLHPNAAGYRKMAAVWNAALQEHLRAYCRTPRAPRLTSSPDTAAYVGIPYRYVAEASGNPAPAFALAQSPPGMTIDPARGRIDWTPAAPGDFVVTARVANGVGSPTEQTFTIHVAEDSLCPSQTSAYYHFDEATSPFADAAGGPPALCAHCPAPTPGQVNQALRFDGAASGLAVAAHDNLLNWGRWDSFSIEFWLRRPGSCQGSTADFNEVVAGRIDPASNLAWWVGVSCQHGGRARFVIRDSDSDNRDLADVVSLTAVTDGNWHHVTVVRDWPAIDIRIYVDGRFEGAAQGFFSSGLASPTAPLDIGWLNLSHGFHLEGILDELAVYNRPLTEGEISRHYASGLQGKTYCRW